MKPRAFAAFALGVVTAASAQDTACRADPLAGRALYLRGSFNGWAATDVHRFTWGCDRFQLVARFDPGDYAFKVGDEGWSADADFGAGPNGNSKIKGAEWKRRLAGVQRITLRLAPDAGPLLVEDCPVPAPLADTVLYLRGSMNDWAATSEYAFQYSCDAYVLNVDLTGQYEFKIADAQWSEKSSSGTGTGTGTGNDTRSFAGPHTLRLALDGGPPQLTIGPRTFADPRIKAVRDPIALSLRFDSRAAAHKTPFGAVTPATLIEWTVDAQPGVDALTLVLEKRRLEGNQALLDYAEQARVPMTPRPNANGGVRWSARQRSAAIGIYGYWFEATIGGRRFALQNNSDAVYWTREKGSGGVASVSELPPDLRNIRRFRQTVYAADFKLPEWAPDIVYYAIVPDRYRNGDQRNDPKPGVARYQNHDVELHQHWIEPPFKPGSGDGSDAVYNNDFFGGDLQGIIDKLDDIRALGANMLYLTPVFRAASNHKYDTADYRHIDPAFGSDADFSRLTRQAARRGIRVLPDTSLNHTGSDSVYFNRFGNHPARGAFDNGVINPHSPYASWYSFDTTQTSPDQQFKGWTDIADLPELNKGSRAFRQFAFGGRDAVMQRWLTRGAAGWRMDVAPWVPDDFWRAWRTAVKAHRPDALTVAETWFDASKYLLGDMFDSTMNYIFRSSVLDYAAGGDAQMLYRNMELLREAYPPQAFFALMNLLSSHDQPRALHHLGWRSAGTDAATVLLAKQRLVLATFFQMTFPGAPSVYYGDEVGVTGGDDPYNRATYPWPDAGGAPDLALQAEFKRLIALRHAHPVLRRGSIDAPLFTDANVIVLARRLGDQWAITATNNASAARQVSVTLPPDLQATQLRDAQRGASVDVVQRRITFDVPPLYGRVLLAP